MRAEPPPNRSGWSAAQRRLHWTVAALVLLAAPVGLAMVSVPFAQLLLKFLLYQAHKSLGLAVLVLAAVQLALHARRGRPPPEPGLSGRQHRAALAAHAALFALLLLVPLTGYLAAAAAPADLPTLFLGIVPVPHVTGPDEALFGAIRSVHAVLAAALVLLAVGHAAMALHHHRRGHAVLLRMWRG
ncbi:MAG: cytochrome b/b6 domain-containing protein [Acetobacteraceae bacterium]